MGLTKLSAWFVRLGIELERIQPGHPEQNGQHERFHLTLKKETTRPVEKSLLKQQQRFDDFIKEFNEERPHEALGLKTPAEVYQKSLKPMPKHLDPLEYPTCDLTRRVSLCGSVPFGTKRADNRKFYLGTAIGGENIGLKHLEEGLWKIEFMHYELGIYDENQNLFTPNP